MTNLYFTAVYILSQHQVSYSKELCEKIFVLKMKVGSHWIGKLVTRLHFTHTILATSFWMHSTYYVEV